MITVSDQGAVRVVELDHGKVNAFDLDLFSSLIAEFRDGDPGQPVVLTGAGRTFSAGLDLRRIVDGGPDYVTDLLGALSECLMAVFDHPAPVVAAVNGPAIAGGCVLAAACDIRVISRGPIGMPELSVGVPFPAAVLEILRGVLGARTGQLVVTGGLLTAAEALAIGLVDEVVDPAELSEHAIAHARRLAALSPGVFAHTKRHLQHPTRERIVAAREDDAAVTAMWASDDVLRAIATYLDSLGRG